MRGDEDEQRQVQYLLWYVLETTLRLLHPVMPFITEEIWQAIPHEGESLMCREFPVADFRRIDEATEKQAEEMMEITRAIRNLRAEIGVAPGKPINVLMTSSSPEALKRLQSIAGSVMPLARVGDIQYGESLSDDEKRDHVSAHFVDYDLNVPMAGLIDIDKELARLGQELQSIDKELARVSGKLSNEQFTAKAPAEVVEKERRILHELTDKKVKLEERLAGLKS